MRENLRIGSIILIIAGLVLAYVSNNRGKERAMLESTGIEVPGKLENALVKTKIGRRSGTSAWIAVEYSPKDQAAITQQFEVTIGYLDSISKGDEITVETVPVVYSAANPKVAIIRGGSVSSGGSRATMLMLYIAAAGGAGFLLSLLLGVPRQS